MKPISRLQYITKTADLAEQACKGGVDWIQLRLKDISYEEYRAKALEVQAVCKKYNATFIVNDNIKLALDINADGVHVGKEDPLPQNDIDEMLARGCIIGVTTNDLDDLRHLQGKPVSYAGLGPYRFTETKKKLSPVLGLNGYRKLFNQLKTQNITYPPVIGIGGITVDDVSVLMSTGLHGIAVSGAISNAPDITETAGKFLDFLDPASKQVKKNILINASLIEVWKSITTPVLLKEWLYDTPVEVISDWKEGNPVAFKGTWHNKPYVDKGNIVCLEPESLFTYTYWSQLSQLPDEPENYTLIEFKLEPDNNKTLLILTQSNFLTDTMYRHYNFYWTLTLDRLKKITERR